MPIQIFWVWSLDEFRLSLTQKTPLTQKGVASPDLIQRRAREGVVGIKGFLSMLRTGTNISLFLLLRLFLETCVKPG
jgi:hypothetical protein